MENYKTLRRSIKKTTRRDKISYPEEMAAEAEQDEGNHQKTLL